MSKRSAGLLPYRHVAGVLELTVPAASPSRRPAGSWFPDRLPFSTGSTRWSAAISSQGKEGIDFVEQSTLY